MAGRFLTLGSRPCGSCGCNPDRHLARLRNQGSRLDCLLKMSVESARIRRKLGNTHGSPGAETAFANEAGLGRERRNPLSIESG